MRFNTLEIKPGESNVVFRRLRGKWHFHPDQSVDLAVVPWADPEPNSPIAESYRIYSFNAEHFLPRVEWGSVPPEYATHLDELNSQIGTGPKTEGHIVYTIGLLPQLYSEHRNLPTWKGARTSSDFLQKSVGEQLRTRGGSCARESGSGFSVRGNTTMEGSSFTTGKRRARSRSFTFLRS